MTESLIDEPLQQKVNILELNRLKVLDENEESVYISSFWKTNPAILIFIRHFGCIACRGHVDQVWSRKDEIQKNGSKIVFIGNGDSYMISEFKKEMNVLNAPIFTDPTLKTFDAIGLFRGVGAILNPRSIKEMIKLYNKGYSQGKIQKGNGFHTQLGGIIIMKPPGIVTYHYVSQYIGDYGGVP